MTSVMEPQVSTEEELEDRRNWRNKASCRQADLALFFPERSDRKDDDDDDDELKLDEPDEPDYPLPEAKRICDACPVRPECLEWAMEILPDYGTFAGMSAYQRRLIGRRKPRKRCPGCSSEDVAIQERNEICLACGISWDRGLLDVDDV